MFLSSCPSSSASPAEAQAKEKNQQRSSAAAPATRLRNAQSRRQNRHSTFEALARGVRVSELPATLRYPTASSSPVVEEEAEEEERQAKDIKKEMEILKEKQPLVDTPSSFASSSDPSPAPPKNNAVVELKPHIEMTASSSAPLLKNWKAGTARDLPAATPNPYYYNDELMPSAISNELLEFDDFGNPVRTPVAPADRKPHPLLIPYMNKDASAESSAPQKDPKYCDALRDHLFGNAPIDVTKHHFKHQFEQTMSKTKVRRRRKFLEQQKEKLE